MNDIVDILISCWNVLWNFKLFNISVVVWISIPLVVGLIFDFVKGVKNGKEDS